jgi:DCN1-like protein 3
MASGDAERKFNSRVETSSCQRLKNCSGASRESGKMQFWKKVWGSCSMTCGQPHGVSSVGKLQAATMCEFTKEFVDGCKALSAESIDGLCAQFISLFTAAKQEYKFKDPH